MNFIEFIYDSLNSKFHSVGVFVDPCNTIDALNHYMLNGACFLRSAMAVKSS